VEKDFQEWINLSLRAPSGDNSQPWEITYYEDFFYISINEKAAQHFLDQNFAASWISLGCLCENLLQSSKHFGFNCQFSIESNMSVVVRFQRVAKENKQSVIDSIKNRATFRGKLHKVEFNIQKIVNHQEQSKSSFRWHQRNQVSSEIINEWAELESFLWLKTPLMKDFARWVHFTLNGYLDGVTLKNLMLNLFDQVSFVFIKLFPFVIYFIPFWFYKYNTQKRLNFLLANASGLVFLEGKINSITDYFYAGQEIQKMWIYITQQGLKAQPLSIQSLFFNFTENEINKKYLSDSQLEKIKNIKRNTKGKFGVEQDLIFMLRFGQSAEALDPLPRKTLQSILKKNIAS
jgi:hypothetical protein